MIIRESIESDLDGLLGAARLAFGDHEGHEIVELVSGLLNDPSAKPLLSLVALSDGRIIGHILFTKARVVSAEKVSAVILAPLAVVPGAQSRGVGGQLIAEGSRILAGKGVELVFVLGHPGYYPRHGFKPAFGYGFKAPYPIPGEVADAWMVRELIPGTIDRARGPVLCASALDHPAYWSE